MCMLLQDGVHIGLVTCVIMRADCPVGHASLLCICLLCSKVPGSSLLSYIHKPPSFALEGALQLLWLYISSRPLPVHQIDVCTVTHTLVTVSWVLQGEAWLCKQCSFLLVTHDRVVCLQKPEACPSNTSPESVPSPAQLQPCIVPDESTHAAGMHPDAFIARQPGNATQGVLLIKPQRWMSQLQSGDHSHSDDVLLCPR